MLAHAQKEFRALAREEKAKQVARAAGMKYNNFQRMNKCLSILSPPGGTFEDD